MDLQGWAQYLTADVVSVHATAGAFAALKNDGSVYAWGNKFAGGGVSSRTRSDLVDAMQLAATRSAFAAVLTSGSVVAWGSSGSGGVIPSSTLATLDGNTKYVLAGDRIFVAITDTGKFVQWGHDDDDAVSVTRTATAEMKLLTHTVSAFTAVRYNGTVEVWGQTDVGGDVSSVREKLTNVTSVKSSSRAFAALTGDGDVLSWGSSGYGATDTVYHDVKQVHRTSRAFAVLHLNRSLSAWGSEHFGGSLGTMAAYVLQDVKKVCSNEVAFTAIKSDGSAIAWGHTFSLGQSGLIVNGNFSSLTSC